MSDLTRFLNRSPSVATDAILSVALGALAGFAVNLVVPGFCLDLDQYLGWASAGLVTVLIYQRQRDNLRKAKPGFME